MYIYTIESNRSGEPCNEDTKCSICCYPSFCIYLIIMNMFAVLRCPPFIVPPYMAEPDCADGHIQGATCTFGCTYGAQLLGANNATCVRDAATGDTMWLYESGPSPVCEGTKMISAVYRFIHLLLYSPTYLYIV